MGRTLAIALLIVFCLSLPTHADTLQVMVVEVQDGKTIIVENTGRRIKVVLKGADAPELGQPLGDVARQHLSNLILGKQVAVEFTGMAYGSHFVAKVFSGDVDINLQMVRDGAAWYDKQYEKDMSEVDRRLYAESEQAARNEHRGIWQDPNPTPPWEWRRAKAAPQTAAPQKTAPVVSTPMTRKSPVVSREDSAWPILSPEGAPFSVRMPGGGQQYSTAIRLPEGQNINANVYWVRHLKIAYIAEWASVPAQPEAIPKLFDKMLEYLNGASAASGLSCEFKREKDTTFNGYTGRRYIVEGCYYHGGIRLYYKVEGKTLKSCMVGVLGEDPNDPSINEFLESFVIREAAKN